MKSFMTHYERAVDFDWVFRVLIKGSGSAIARLWSDYNAGSKDASAAMRRRCGWSMNAGARRLIGQLKGK
jgi:hypothetical protein